MPCTMGACRRSPQRTPALLVFGCAVLFSHQCGGVELSMVGARGNETDSLSHAQSTQSEVPLLLGDASATGLPTYFAPSRGGLPSASGSNNTSVTNSGKPTVPLLATDSPTAPGVQNNTIPSDSAGTAARFLRGPSSDEMEGKNSSSYLDAFEAAYEQYLADYEAYLEAYYDAYAQPPAAHPLHAGYAVAGVKPLPARLPYFQTPPAGYPDFPYVFGYPVIFNGAGMIT